MKNKNVNLTRKVTKNLNNKIVLREINNARNKAGMGKLNITKRECLRCGKKFRSLGKHNRICESCTQYDKHHGGEDDIFYY